MDQQRLCYLLNKYQKQTITSDEFAELDNWYHLVNQIGADFDAWVAASGGEDSFSDELLIEFKGKRNARIKKFEHRIWMRGVAAALIVCLSAATYIYLSRQQKSQQTAQNQINDITPGHNQATLTLANGQKIILTKGLSGRLAVQNKTVITAGQNSITYKATQTGDQSVYNTLSTARGEQSPLPLVLADGTKVWLNAESSITFPTAFNGKERIVKITGEALFEVVHNAKQPFKVQTEKQTIEDIGTTFDVNAYADEAVTKTTLVEGSVKVNGIKLKPNEQTDGTHIKTVNVKRYTAWKNGDFDFEDENIQTIMRQLSRWYNIEVIYEGNITNDGLTAQITRNRNISGILHILQNTKTVKFKIEGRRITVIE